MNYSKHICVSLSHTGIKDCVRAIQKYPLVEVRLDLMDVTLDEIPLLFDGKCSIVVTCRKGGRVDRDRLTLLRKCIVSGAAYVDIEIESDAYYRKSLTELAKKNGCKVILSYHNFEATPPAKDLCKKIKSSFDREADIVKVACRINSLSDNATVLALYEKFTNIIAIGMGENGKITRLAAPFLGAPFTYASESNQTQTAPGQMDYLTLLSLMKKLNPSIEGGGSNPDNDVI